MLEFANLLNYLALTLKKTTHSLLFCRHHKKDEKIDFFRMQQILIKNAARKSVKTILVSMEKNRIEYPD